MTPDEITRGLVALGFRKAGKTTADRTRAVQDFQRGWALGPALAIDGKPGAATQRALKVSLDRKAKRLGTASPSFSFAEFTCHCGGRQSRCAVIRVHRGLLESLEHYRARLGHDVKVVSGYRCPQHNASVGGASSSQHLYGAACDLEPAVNHLTLAKWRLFAGIGYKRSTKQVTHVDRRDVSGNNTTGGTKDRPTDWIYSS